MWWANRRRSTEAVSCTCPATNAPVPSGERLPRSPAGEDGMDGDGVPHGSHAQLIPGEAKVRPVDPDLGVELHLLVTGSGHGDREGQGLGALADLEGPGRDGSVAGQRDPLGREDDVRVSGAGVEVGGAQMRITFLDLGVD